MYIVSSRVYCVTCSVKSIQV